MKTAQRMRELRLEKNMTLKETAFLLEVPVSTYRDWEYGRKVPADIISKLAEIFDVPISIFSMKGPTSTVELKRAAVLLEEALKIVRNAI